MKRSEVNAAIEAAKAHFAAHHWALPPNPRWDVTDFGLGDFSRWGLVLVNLAEEEEYCEKVMYAVRGQETPAHTHFRKKEDIIVRAGSLAITLWQGQPEKAGNASFAIQINGEKRACTSGAVQILQAGERITLTPGIFHAFWPTSEACIIGEVSTANDDAHDNIFADPNVGRFSELIEDEAPVAALVSDNKPL
ncbi:MAG: D-lyxose/D-mannose family sugar isomerase [Bacteroidetes bacterium]|nr:MAG: D-lyxose/D-mannose family sugar isomerase [Bacteroidota bacterium]